VGAGGGITGTGTGTGTGATCGVGATWGAGEGQGPQTGIDEWTYLDTFFKRYNKVLLDVMAIDLGTSVLLLYVCCELQAWRR